LQNQVCRHPRPHRPADKNFGNTALYDRLEQPPENIALTEPSMPVAREGRMVRHLALKSQAAEPAIGEVQMSLLAQSALGTDSKTITDDQHSDHQLGINGWAAIRAIQWRKHTAHLAEIEKTVDPA